MFHIDLINFKPVLAIAGGPRTTDHGRTDEFCDHIASLVLRTDWLIILFLGHVRLFPVINDHEVIILAAFNCP